MSSNILYQAHEDPRYSLLERRLRTIGDMLLSRGLVKTHPGNNTGEFYQGKNFTMKSYWWGDECNCNLVLTPEQAKLVENDLGDDIERTFHQNDCPSEGPNFYCQELKVWWYKYLGRAMDFNDVPVARINEILNQIEKEICGSA